ncbi:MAG TPA: phospholipid carrier-dependent glycosyltransferase [Chthoniobacterales bacterium]|nr:phospholipid carrier-dependent glycosyltransferase [Chthoniobacterales bacterium]
MQPAIRNYALVFFGALLFHVAGTWTFPLIDRDEPRFAEASREMLQRGDYVVPYLNNRFRFDKPPLTYWCQTASYRVFGENDFAARLPSVMAAALTALLLFAWGRRVGNERIGWWAAIIFTLCLQTLVHAKAAVADMWLVFFMTAAHWAGYELLRDRMQDGVETAATFPAPARRWWWTFYAALALAFLAKGPVGWLPLITVAATKFFLPDLKLTRRFLFLTGGLFTLSLVAFWGIPALVRTHGEFFAIGIGRHVVARSVVAMEGHGADSFWSYLGTLPFYFVLVFVSFFPWSIKLPWLTKKLWRRRDTFDRYLIAGVAVMFIVFTLVKTKLPHYTLPAFPLLALLLAKALADLSGAERFVRRTAATAALAAILAVAGITMAARYSPSLQLVRQARGDLTREMEFGALVYREPSLIWYSRRYVDGWMTNLDENGMKPFFAKAGGRFAVMPTALAQKIFPTLPTGWKSYSVHGFNIANGKWVDLTLVLKPV